MTIEVAGTNTWNKGAELMLVAIRERFARVHPAVQLAVDPSFGTYAERARYGLAQKVSLERWGRSRLAVELMPPSFRQAYGLVTDKDLDAVLDASGFAFGDQHPVDRTTRFANQVEAWTATGKPVVLLPQALGPFDRPTLRDGFARVAAAATHIFARDPVSLEHAQKAAGPHAGKVTLAPDFTNLVKPPASLVSLQEGVACIVPNQRMIEKASSKTEADAYIPLLSMTIHALKARGLQPVLLIHGSHDGPLADSVQQHLGRSLDVIREDDPVRIKAMLGQAHVVVASRFHALVSALAQGVPAIATSWSHKYEMLFRDYGCEDLILPVPATQAQIEAAVERATGAARASLVGCLRERGADLRRQAEAMWQQVDNVLGLEQHPVPHLVEEEAGGNP